MTRARRDQRWREQAARLLADAHPHRVQRHLAVSESHRFDVALVRSYCERLIAEADALDMEREVFADWTRAHGKGPEDRARFPTRYRRFAVTPCGESATSIDVWHRDRSVWRIEVLPSSLRGAVVTAHTMRTPIVERWRLGVGVLEIVAVDVCIAPGAANSVAIACIDESPDLGGWPGNLAREYVAEQRARRKCSRRDCDGGVLMASFPVTEARTKAGVQQLPAGARVTIRGPGKCPECEAFKSTRMSRAFVNGGNLRRAAQRLLDMLDGRCPWNADAPVQPNECRGCRGSAYYIDITDGHEIECLTCNGTGHNLRGKLPPLPEETRRLLNVARRQTRRREIEIRVREEINAFMRETPNAPLTPATLELIEGRMRQALRQVGADTFGVRITQSGNNVQVVLIDPPNNGAF